MRPLSYRPRHSALLATAAKGSMAGEVAEPVEALLPICSQKHDITLGIVDHKSERFRS
jgi:hypothetical protein